MSTIKLILIFIYSISLNAVFGQDTLLIKVLKQLRETYYVNKTDLLSDSYSTEKRIVIDVETQTSSFNIRIKNYTDTTIHYITDHRKLFMVQEILTSEGIWKPIENFPYCDYSNCFTEQTLESNHYIDTKAFYRPGNLKTKLRFHLKAINADIYSEGISISIDEKSID